MIFSQIFIKGGLRASPETTRGEILVFFAVPPSNNFTFTWHIPFPLTIRQVEVSVKVTNMVRYRVTNLLSWRMSGCKSQKTRVILCTAHTMRGISKHIFHLKTQTFKFFSSWQQVHSTSFICLSQGIVRSLERARDTYQTWEPSVKTVTETKITRRYDWDVEGVKCQHTHLRLIFSFHAGKNSTTKLLESLCDVKSHCSQTAQDKNINYVCYVSTVCER